MRKLPLLTNSSLTMFRRCPREYYFAYVLRRRSKTKSEALRFGSFFHVGLNAWWGSGLDPQMRLVKAYNAMAAESAVGGMSPFELVKAEELILGYTVRWGNEPYETLAVELQFRLPITLPDSRAPMYDQGGAIDAVVRSYRAPVHITHIVEHKTTSQDISPGSPYWQHVAVLDSQVSTYMKAARELGYGPRDTIYDVIKKPNILPLKATPEEAKKYTIPTKKEPKPRLYANMRETDETPEEYRTRLRNDIASNPDKYYQRQAIVRLEADDAAHEADTVATAEMIRFCEERNAWPRSPVSCFRYGRRCDYAPVCEGSASIDDSRYETKEHTHEELGDI